MPINSIEIICLPCPKCEGLEQKIRDIVKSIEMVNKIKIACEFKVTRDLSHVDRYSIGPSQTPAIVINGSLETAGRVDLILLRRRLRLCRKAAKKRTADEVNQLHFQINFSSSASVNIAYPGKRFQGLEIK